MDVIGTIRKNRAHLPKSILGKKWAKGDQGQRTIRYCDPLYLVNWMDKKPVLIMASTSNALKENDTYNRRRTALKPQCIHDYNRIMPGIDKSDQMKFGRKVARRKVKKYYKTIFYHLFDCILINSFQYFLKIPQMAKKTHNQFRIALIKQLIAKYNVNAADPDVENEQDAAETQPTTINNDQTDALHVPVYHQTAKGCCYCRKFKEKQERYAQSFWRCQACQEYYCLNGKRQCFTDFHQQNAVLLGLKAPSRRSTRTRANTTG